MHEGARHERTCGLLSRKVGVAEVHGLAGAVRSISGGKVQLGGLRQVPVPIACRGDVQQLVDADEKGGFGIGLH